MPEPGVLQACVGNNDDSGLRVHGLGMSFKDGLSYL